MHNNGQNIIMTLGSSDAILEKSVCVVRERKKCVRQPTTDQLDKTTCDELVV